ncbi:MAG TPA: fasciclin domain-containing protein [Pyrinomonadaceae bacterium]|nr:fasciclin domain-containing protein [Pyrinomonadaceae bacterium]
MKMKKSFLMLVMAVAALAAGSSNTFAQDNPMVGGAAMYRTKDIVDNAVNSQDHTTLVAAVKAAGLVGTLKGKGPFTVFAPTNAAFEKLPSGTVETLLRPENKGTLTKVLTYHVVAGRMDSKAIMKAIRKGGGTATLTTVSGDKLMAMMSGDRLVLRDEKGGTSTVTTANVYQSNGVIHVVDTVVMPN